MAWVPIHAGQDHFQGFARRKATDALTELIWNGLDAEADVVDVDIDVQSMIDGSREMTYVTRITVRDKCRTRPLVIHPVVSSPSGGQSWDDAAL